MAAFLDMTLGVTIAVVLGLVAGVPVVAGAGDQAAAAVGTGVCSRHSPG